MNVLQTWVQQLPMTQQTVLLTAIRAPDGVEKYHVSKPLLRWYRRCVLLSAMDGQVLSRPFNHDTDNAGGSFTGPSYTVADLHNAELVWPRLMNDIVGRYIQAQDQMPWHFQMHFLHACEIVGYKHADMDIKHWWGRVYDRLVDTLHLHPETEEEMDLRLGDSRDQWLARNDTATVD